jgi:hypothetical protein
METPDTRTERLIDDLIEAQIGSLPPDQRTVIKEQILRLLRDKVNELAVKGEFEA